MKAAAAQAVRRDAFVDVALRLITVKGYEQMSVQDVLEEVGASKGAFYHYFDSKRALLLAVIERMTDAALEQVAPMLHDPDLSAVEKLDGFFQGIAAWKGERRDFVLGTLLQTWVSDDNAIVREKARRSARDRIVPIVAAIVRQGVEEGLFTVSSPDDTAMVVVSVILGFQEIATDLFFARQAGAITFAAVERGLAAELEALDRILGVPAGSFRGLDRATLRQWFD